jgi:hypothetical protein
MSAHEFLEDDYFIGTYSQKFPYREMSEKAIDLYYSRNPKDSQFCYSDHYESFNSKFNRLSSYLLQAGNQDKMRLLYETYLKLLAEFNEGEELIQNLGYISNAL